MDPDPDRRDGRTDSTTHQPTQGTADRDGRTTAPPDASRPGSSRSATSPATPRSGTSPSGPRTYLSEDVKARYSAFYREAVPRLVAYVRYLGATPAQAADCVQDVLVGMLVPFDNITHPYAVARQAVRRRYFRLLFEAREEPCEELEAKGHPLIADPHPWEELEQRFRYLPLLPQLPEKQRIVMALTLDELSPSQIATDLGGNVTAEQVRSNLRLARRRLRELMEQAECEQEDGE